jgi:hypothetical protein
VSHDDGEEEAVSCYPESIVAIDEEEEEEEVVRREAVSC